VTSRERTTLLLRRFSDGDEGVAAELYASIQGELRDRGPVRHDSEVSCQTHDMAFHRWLNKPLMQSKREATSRRSPATWGPAPLACAGAPGLTLGFFSYIAAEAARAA
jgi:hypothetical protein